MGEGTKMDNSDTVVPPDSAAAVAAADIPTIDFGPFLVDEGVIVGNEPTEAQRSVAEQIDVACRVHGFIHLINFGLSDALRQRCFAASKELFDLSTEHKESKMSRIKPETNIGYAPYQSEKLNPNRAKLELKEAFNVRFQPKWTNDFAGCPESYQTTVEELMDVLKNAAIRYAYACALALKLPKDFFANTLHDFDLATIRFLHGPECGDIYKKHHDDSTSKEPIIRVGEHTDFGAYTFLLLGEHGAEGLQIKSVEGGEVAKDKVDTGWNDVVVPTNPVTGAIINTGALMARWTNDIWKATAHRVIVPNATIANRERFSIAFFVDPDSNEMIKVHDQCCIREENDENAGGENKTKKKYEPIKSSDYLKMKLTQMMKPESSSSSSKD